MKKTTYTTIRFDVRDGFYVEVSPNVDGKGKSMYDFFLCLEGYGIKVHMIGLYAEDCPPETWERLIENEVDEHIEMFIEDMDNWES